MSESKKRKMNDDSASSSLDANLKYQSVKQQQQDDYAEQSPSSLAMSDLPMDESAENTDAQAIDSKDLSFLLSDLPSSLRLISTLANDLPTCKLPQFHALRKQVLRLAAALENVSLLHIHSLSTRIHRLNTR